MTAETLTALRELDCRQSGSLQVRLLWNASDGAVWVVAIDTRTGGSFRLEVRDGEGPVDVFNHPFAYAALHRVQTDLGAADTECAQMSI